MQSAWRITITPSDFFVLNVPSASDIDVGELAVNTADAKLFTKHTDGSIQTLGKDVATEATALAIALG